jgi:site-specific recombinase XerD
LKGLSQSGVWPSGNPRLYLRRKGHKAIAMPDAAKDSAAFLAAYAAGIATDPAKTASTGPGTIGAAVTAYMRSEHYLGLAASTRGQWRLHLDTIRADYGAPKLADLRAQHIRAHLGKLNPHSANNRLKVWKALCRWAVQVGLIDTDPTRDVAKWKTIDKGGHTPWTRDDLDLFRARWPHDSEQRLAMELIYATAAAIGDACRLSIGMVDKDGWLTYARQKSRTIATSPIFAQAPDWFEQTDDLQRCLDLRPRRMLFLESRTGQARSPKAATHWFSAACRAAGLTDGKAAHGLRKLRAAMFRENGASADQRMAILGHESASEARRYSRSADNRKIISGTDISNPLPTRGNIAAKSTR